MAISVDCPSCGKTLKAKDSAAGMTAKCPSCSEPIQIPEISEVYDAEDEFGVTASAGTDLPRNSGAASDQRPCPMCGELINALAKKCRFCGEVFDKKLKKKQSMSSGGDEMGAGEWIVCLLCPGIGCIVGIVYAVQGKSTGGKMIGISIGMIIFWNIISFVVQMALQQ